ncbi:hypothetical protein QBC43DRAFT_301785 [Cladorrhinum sp. PSN259]|nr:hypothetical protein QBC43DRAFT_301785 [Cladorrhinum sp. PSN259]
MKQMGYSVVGVSARWKGKGVMRGHWYEVLNGGDDGIDIDVDDSENNREDSSSSDIAGGNDEDHHHRMEVTGSSSNSRMRNNTRQQQKMETRKKRMWNTFLTDGVGSIAALYVSVADLGVLSEMGMSVSAERAAYGEEGFILQDL